MGKKPVKNQHFVPKFLLRHFAVPNTREKAIAVLNLERGMVIPETSIRLQGAESFIYGKDDIIEKKLSKLETDTSNIIKKIIGTMTAPLFESEEWYRLIIFFAAQHGRTPSAAREALAEVDQVRQAILKSAEKRGIPKEEIDFSQIGPMEKPEVFTLSSALRNAPLIYDLKDLIVINDSEIEFAINDCGIIMHNHWADGARSFGVNGFCCRGIIFFLPLSPRVMLVKYDHEIYQPTGIVGNVVRLGLSEVKAMNYLQIIYAEENIYFTGDPATEARLKKLSMTAPRSKRSSQVRADLFQDESGSDQELIMIRSERPRISLHLPWLPVRKPFASRPMHHRVKQYRQASLRLKEEWDRVHGPMGNPPELGMAGRVFRRV